MSAPDREADHDRVIDARDGVDPADTTDRFDPEGEVELAALIETLRAATPPREVLAPIRAQVVRSDTTRAVRRMPRVSAWQAAAVLAITFALGVLARDAMLARPMSASAVVAPPEPAAPAAPEEPALALVPAPPVEVIDDATIPSPVARFVETAGSFPSIDDDGAEAAVDVTGDRCEPPVDEVLDCHDPVAP